MAFSNLLNSQFFSTQGSPRQSYHYTRQCSGGACPWKVVESVSFLVYHKFCSARKKESKKRAAAGKEARDEGAGRGWAA